MSKAMPVKLSGDLIEEARTASAALHRSLTAQIEHWATIGRIAEAHLSGDALRSLVSKAGGPLKIAHAEESSPRRQIAEALEAFVNREHDNDWLREITASGVAVHGNEPGEPITQLAPKSSAASETSIREVARAAG